MNTYYTLQFPGARDFFHGELLTVDSMQQQWLEAGMQLQRSWFENARGLFGYYRDIAVDAQKLQGLLFEQYVSWLKGWNEIPGPFVAENPAAAEIEETTAQPVTAEAPRLLGWVVDDLTRIQGIGKVLQDRLYKEGIVSYYEIASWDEKEIARIENEVLGSRFAGRIERDQWQAQAKKLMQG